MSEFNHTLNSITCITICQNLNLKTVLYGFFACIRIYTIHGRYQMNKSKLTGINESEGKDKKGQPPPISFRPDPENAKILDFLVENGRNRSEFINEAIRMQFPELVNRQYPELIYELRKEEAKARELLEKIETARFKKKHHLQ